VIPRIRSLVDPAETTVRGRLGTPHEISSCINLIRSRYHQLVGRQAKVRFYDRVRPDYWPHASAALALDSCLASPLRHETDRCENVRWSPAEPGGAP
jgi:hypothetical protein